MDKNILIVTTEFPPMPGGIGNHAYCLAKELGRLGYQVSVMTEQRESRAGDWEKFVESNRDLEIVGLRRQKAVVLTYLLRIVRLFQLLAGAKTFQTVIYSGKFSVWLGALAPQTKSLVVVHGSEIKQQGFWKSLFGRGLKRARAIVCVSNYTKNQLLAHYPDIDETKISVVNNGFRDGFAAESSAAKNLRPESLDLITVGGIHQRKGQFNVVRALPEIAASFPQAKYRVVGLPLEKDRLLDLIETRKVDGRVTFHHGLSDLEVRETLARSDVFIMLSEHLDNGDFEGFGIAVVEAMSLGVPAIGSRDSGIADAIRDGYSGKLVDPHNAPEIVEALRKITVDYESYSTNAKKWAEGFQWKNKVREYLSIIDKL